jgi:hypothetical protein
MHMALRKAIRACINGLRHWLSEVEQVPEVPFDNSYDWIGATYLKLANDPISKKKGAYIWGVLQGAALGKVLGFKRVSVIEFGVAGGRGLLAMERVAERVEEMIGLEIDVYGFDAESGLPMPEDYRDLPNLFSRGHFPMDKKQVEKQLRRAKLNLGLVKKTVPLFLESKPAPIAFVSIDLDLYSSTRDAFRLFEAGDSLLLPRVLCYFDDILGFTYNDYTGERLAISEFNATHSMRKLSPIYGLRYFMPSRLAETPLAETFFFLHIFNHRLYNHPDSLRKVTTITIEGGEIRSEVIPAPHPGPQNQAETEIQNGGKARKYSTAAKSGSS